MTENAVESAIIGFAQRLGWRPTRNQVGLFERTGGGKIKVGIKHFPDWTLTRGTGSPGLCQLFHVEVKAPGKKPNSGQFEMLASLNHVGELAFWSDSLDMFKTIYHQNYPGDFNAQS